MKTSPFHQLANLLTVGDICSEFIEIFDVKDSGEEVSLIWNELCYEKGTNPMDQIALVVQCEKILGWTGYDMLLSNNTIGDCMETISPDSLMTADTSLLEAVRLLSKSTVNFFMVLKGNQYLGWFSNEDLYKHPFQLCLFAILINLEKMLLEVITLSPIQSLQSLSRNRLIKAENVYRLRKYKLNEAGIPFKSKLLECTTLIDRICIARKCKNIKSKVTALGNKTFCRDFEKLRNKIAHPELKYDSTLFNPEKLWHFIEWAEFLESELNELLVKTKNS